VITDRANRPALVGLALFAVTAGWALALALAGAGEGLLYLAPALLLAAPLALGRYLGEDTLAWLARHPQERRRSPRPVRVLRPTSPGPARVLVGRSVIGSGLARRPPPALALS
jgi:hypothetical protein